MAKRKIVKIDQEKCTGCGLCIPACPEGALQIIDGKARLVSDLFCDGLGACLGPCPEGAISIEEREAEPYDESKIMKNIIKQGKNTIKAHLKHLQDHNQTEFLQQAIAFLKKRNMEVPILEEERIDGYKEIKTCPGIVTQNITKAENQSNEGEKQKSFLTHWPIQLHLISPTAPHYKKTDVLLCADCVAYTAGDFHKEYLQGKTLAIACPKLDQGREIYLEKIQSWIDDAMINTLTVLIMQVPCCKGLLLLAKEAVSKAKRKIPLKVIMIDIKGEILTEEWI
jgi:ferredoxin